ncbi:MAG TPA: hypothetical protein VK028_02125 [Micromonosporaceae bacterium]|nr:hypothetical protein [Micromonosporaceae bacterium]
MRRFGAGLVALLALAAVAGCAQPGQPPGAAAPEAEVHGPWEFCESAAPEEWPNADATELPRLPETFEPVGVVVCDLRPEHRADGGQDLVAVEGHAYEIAELLAAVRLPDEPRWPGACTMELRVIPWFAFLDAEGRWVRPGVPVDGCGKIRMEVIDALTGLDLTEESRRVVREIESAESVAAGCAQGWADMVWVETTQPGRTWASQPIDPFPADATIRLCVYRVPADQQGTGKPGGDFEHGRVLAAADRAAVADALRAAGPAGSCSRPASRFALLRRIDNVGGEVYIELDGCRRILSYSHEDPPALGQADAALVELLGRPS